MPALQKQPISLNFAMGLDTKTDSKQVQIGKFLTLVNSVFDKQGALVKRDGYPNITSLPNDTQTTLTTLNNNLIATGSNLYAFSQDTDQWLDQGLVQPVSIDTLPLVRVSTSQTSPDAAVSANGLTCLAYVDNSVAYYQVSDSVTGQQIVPRVTLPSTSANPRVFLLGRYFIITFMRTVSATTHLSYIAIPITMPASPLAAADVDTTVLSLTTGYDGYVANNNLYLAWAGSSTTIRLKYLSSTLIVSAVRVLAGSHTADLMSVTADVSASTAVIWITFWDVTSHAGYVAAFNQNLVPILAATQIIAGLTLEEITSVATNGVINVFYEVLNNYNSSGAYPNTVKTDFINTVAVTQAGSVGSTTTILRSVGLASKAFIDVSGKIYVFATYGEGNQPTYFLIDSTGAIYARLAYSNGGGYENSQVLPSVSLLGSTYLVPYLIKDFLASVNKGTDLPSGTPVNGIYTQTGINLLKFSINTSGQHSSEIAGALHLTGGQLWEYDGVRPVEHSFQVWPDNVAGTTATTGGLVTNQLYYYVFTYEWTDNAGNLHRSAPSIPFPLTTTGSDVSANTLYVPTDRLTYKVSPNPIRIVGYRWSVAQQVYYQFTSLTSPTINNTAVDYVTIVDTLADSAILGNVLLYTTGGVVENIAAPASIASALFKNRIFLIDAEDRNLLWYSKQVIENTPVEMSDLFTLYVAPTTGAQGSTGPMTAISAMDDKLIIFKKDAIYYITGTGPDNTGAQNDFTDAVYVTSSVGCANPNSIILMPNGIMFQSDKGIWLLGRDLATTYIGAPVEAFNSQVVESATAVPGTNQVRFVLGNNVTLMYDYFYGQWGTFTNILAISSTLYQGKDTYLNSLGQVYQETPGVYLDGSTPVLMSFTTAWINVAGVQGYERFYYANLLGTYYTPYILNCQLAYDYNPSSTQAIQVTPDNLSPTWGGEANWGAGAAWGGPVNANVFSARLFPQKQKCQSFQLSINEVYDPSFGQPAGQGLNLSGLLLTVGVKRGSRTQSAAKSFG